MAAHEEDTAPEQAMSEGDASDSDGSDSASDSEQNDPPSSLIDAEQYGAHAKVLCCCGQRLHWQ